MTLPAHRSNSQKPRLCARTVDRSNFPGITIFPMALLPSDTLPFAEIARRPLNPQECALVVIDLQEKLLPPIHEKERMVSNSKLLIRMTQVLSLPVIVTTQYAKGLGQTVPEITALL